MPIEAPARGESQRQRLRTALVWLLILPWAVWTVARVFGLEAGPPFVQLIAFTPYVAATALIPVVVSLVARQWWAAGVAGVVAISLALCVLPRTVGSPSTMDGVQLTV